MKRSVAVTLVLMGSAGLSGCGDSEIDSAVYQDFAQCVRSGLYDQDRCEADYRQALASHMQTAPAYTSQQDCEAEFGVGQCEVKSAQEVGLQQAAASQGNSTVQAGGGGSFFLPMMAGYMMGSMLSNNNRMAPQALYRQNGQSAFVNGNGARVAGNTGAVRLRSSSAAVQAPKTRTTTMARGGFGARATSISS